MNVLIAIDGSDFTPRVVQFVIDHRQMWGAPARLTLLTSVPAIPPHAARHLDAESLSAYYGEEARKVFEPALEMLGRAGLQADTLPCKGPAAQAIADAATDGGYGLVLMGSHGHSLLGNMVLGSVVSGVLARCRTPVLVVR